MSKIKAIDLCFFSDDLLVKMTLNGNTDSYSEIVRRYKNRVFGLSLSIVGNYHSAEDIAQETFIDGYVKLSSLTDYSKISTWLCSIAKHKCYNYLSRSPKAYNLEAFEMLPDVYTDSLEDALLNLEKKHLINASLERLPEKVRNVAVMFYYQGYSLKAIAKQLDIPEGTVKRRLFDARAKLKKELSYMSENNNYPSAEFETKINNKIKELKDYYQLHGCSYDGLDSMFTDVINSIESMPESKAKHSAFAEAYYFYSYKDNSYAEKAKEHALLGDNASVICHILIEETIRGNSDNIIRRIDEEGIPKMEALGADNEKGELLFWKGFALSKKDELDKAKAVFQDATRFLNRDNIYYANALAAVKGINLLQENSNYRAGSYITLCGERVRFTNGRLMLVSQPGFNRRFDLNNIFRYSSLYYYASRCDEIFYDEAMNPGNTIVSRDEKAKLTLISKREKLAVAAGCFTDCIHLSLEDDFKADMWYAKDIGLVKMIIAAAGTTETYELYEYKISGGNGFMPLNAGNVWRYKNPDLPGYYNQLIEREIITFDGEYANFSAINFIALAKDCENHPDVDSDLLINLASVHCNNWDLDKSIYYLKLAAQKNSTLKASLMATAGIGYLSRYKEYAMKKYRICPSSICGSNIKKSDGIIIYAEAGSYSLSPYRWGTRHEENKIFGMKPFRFLQSLCGCLYDEKWTVGYSDTHMIDDGTIPVHIRVEGGGTVNVKAGRFENCIKLTIDAELKGADKDYYFRDFSHTYCGRKVYWYAPNVGIVKFDCVWGSSLSSVCELSEYSSVATNGEYMPVYPGCRYVYDEMTLEEGYRARKTYDIVSGMGNDYFMIEAQEFLFLGTEEEYEEMKKQKK